jgi:hypothetical protein
MNARTKIQVESIEQAQRTLEALLDYRPEQLTKAQAIHILLEQIRVAQSKGYSLAAIAKLLTERGIAVSTGALRAYVSEANADAGGKKQKPKSKRSMAAPGASALGAPAVIPAASTSSRAKSRTARSPRPAPLKSVRFFCSRSIAGRGQGSSSPLSGRTWTCTTSSWCSGDRPRTGSSAPPRAAENARFRSPRRSTLRFAASGTHADRVSSATRTVRLCRSGSCTSDSGAHAVAPGYDASDGTTAVTRLHRSSSSLARRFVRFRNGSATPRSP